MKHYEVIIKFGTELICFTKVRSKKEDRNLFDGD